MFSMFELGLSSAEAKVESSYMGDLADLFMTSGSLLK